MELVDAVGGVEIDVLAAITDTRYPTQDRGTMALYFAPGKQHMDGEHALHRYTDTGLTQRDMLRLGPAALWGRSARKHRALQGADVIEVRGGYWIPDYDRTIPCIEAHFGAR